MYTNMKQYNKKKHNYYELEPPPNIRDKESGRPLKKQNFPFEDYKELAKQSNEGNIILDEESKILSQQQRPVQPQPKKQKRPSRPLQIKKIKEKQIVEPKKSQEKIEAPEGPITNAIRPKIPFFSSEVQSQQLAQPKVVEEAIGQFVMSTVNEESIKRIVQFKLSFVNEEMLKIKWVRNKTFIAIYYFSAILAYLFRLYRVIEIFAVLFSGFVLSSDYPFGLQLLKQLYRIRLFLIWFFCGIGYYLVLKVVSLGISALLPPQKSRFNFLKDQLGTYYITKLIDSISLMHSKFRQYNFTSFMFGFSPPFLRLVVWLLQIFGIVTLLVGLNQPVVEFLGSIGMLVIFLQLLGDTIIPLRLSYPVMLLGKIVVYLLIFNHVIALVLQWVTFWQNEASVTTTWNTFYGTITPGQNLLYVEYTAVLILTTFNSVNTVSPVQNAVLIAVVLLAVILNGYIFGIIVDYINKSTQASIEEIMRVADLNSRTGRYRLGLQTTDKLLAGEYILAQIRQSIDQEILVSDPFFKEETLLPKAIELKDYLKYRFELFKRNLIAQTPLFKILGVLGFYSKTGDDGHFDFELDLARAAHFSLISKGFILETDVPYRKVEDKPMALMPDQFIFIQKGIVFFNGDQQAVYSGQHLNLKGLFTTLSSTCEQLTLNQDATCTVLHLRQSQLIECLCKCGVVSLSSSKVMQKFEPDKIPKQIKEDSKLYLSVFYCEPNLVRNQYELQNSIMSISQGLQAISDSSPQSILTAAKLHKIDVSCAIVIIEGKPQLITKAQLSNIIEKVDRYQLFADYSSLLI